MGAMTYIEERDRGMLGVCIIIGVGAVWTPCPIGQKWRAPDVFIDARCFRPPPPGWTGKHMVFRMRSPGGS